MIEPIPDLMALDAWDDFAVGPAPNRTKEELVRLNALTTAWLEAREAEKALESAQKYAIETATYFARMEALDEIERAKKPSKRGRAGKEKIKEVCTV